MNNSYFLYGIILQFFFITACTDAEMHEERNRSDNTLIHFTYNTKGNIGPSENSELMLYIFSRNEDHNSDYFLDSIILLGKAYSSIKFSYDRLRLSDYRFLFVKTPLSPGPEISVVDLNNHLPPKKNCTWQNISIALNTYDLSLNNYFAIQDYTNNQLFHLDTLEVNLKRLVGQVLFNFPISNSVNNKSLSTSSVFDRIYKIEINYSGFGKNVCFTPDKQLQGISINEVNKQTIIPELTSSFRTILPQTYLDTLAGGLIGGQIKGKCFLPIQDKLLIEMIFYYYDTTPCCGIEHIHQTNCFQLKTICLQIPVSSSENGLSVYPDTYTVNTAKIRSKRLIDILFDSGMELDLDWITN